jgi:hypothetical protein
MTPEHEKKVIYVIGFDDDYGVLFVLYRALQWNELDDYLHVTRAVNTDARWEEEHGFETVDEIESWLSKEFPEFHLENETHKEVTL